MYLLVIIVPTNLFQIFSLYKRKSFLNWQKCDPSGSRHFSLRRSVSKILPRSPAGGRTSYATDRSWPRCVWCWQRKCVPRTGYPLVTQSTTWRSRFGAPIGSWWHGLGCQSKRWSFPRERRTSRKSFKLNRINNKGTFYIIIGLV